MKVRRICSEVCGRNSWVNQGHPKVRPETSFIGLGRHLHADNLRVAPKFLPKRHRLVRHRRLQPGQDHSVWTAAETFVRNQASFLAYATSCDRS